MKAGGILLIALGLILAFVALLTDTSVGDTYNLAKGQLQSLQFAGGCVLFIGGIVLLAAGEVNDTLYKLGRLIRKQHKETAAALRDPVAPEDDISLSPSFRDYAATAMTAGSAPTAEEKQAADRLYRTILIGIGIFAVVVVLVTISL